MIVNIFERLLQADDLVFPLRGDERAARVSAAEQFVDQAPMTSLGARMRAVLESSDNNLKTTTELTPAEQKLIAAMSVGEVCLTCRV